MKKMESVNKTHCKAGGRLIRFLKIVKVAIILVSIGSTGVYANSNASSYGSKVNSISTQQVVVTGMVTDEDAHPLPGVTVVVKGTTVGVITNVDGYFSIEVPENSKVLVFSFIGMETKEVMIGEKTSLEISLSSSTVDLDDVVVVGYGSQRKTHLTGAISRVDTKGLEDVPVSDISQVLQGRLPGLSVRNVSGQVGDEMQIRVRGISSISAGGSPLVVVDGIPVADGLSMIDMNDVASVEVLKDASSAAIYGSRGANGVILITTHMGEPKKPKFSFRASVGLKSIIKEYDILSTQEFTDYYRNERQLVENLNAENSGREAETVGYNGTEQMMHYIQENSGGETNWIDEVSQSLATIQKYSLSFSGGVKNYSYYVSANYSKDEGILMNNYLNKLNLTVKLKAKLSSKAEIGFNMIPSYVDRERSTASFSTISVYPSFMPTRHNEFTAGLTQGPGRGNKKVGDYAHLRDFGKSNETYTFQLFDEYGNPYLNKITNASLKASSNNNPLSRIENQTRKYNQYKMLTNLYFKYDILKGLSFKTSVGSYVRYDTRDDYSGVEAHYSGANYAADFSRLRVNVINENILTYDLKRGKHKLNLLAGATVESTDQKTRQIKAVLFPTDYVQTINAASGIVLEENGNPRTYSLVSDTRLASFLGRVNYDFADKYLISATLRTDGSSLFGAEKRWGVFPSLSVGWRLSEEKFIKSIPSISNLKLRASVGVTGNNNIENYANETLMQMGNYIQNGSVVGSIGSTQTHGNPNLTWEQTMEYNVGLNASFFNSRVSFELDYYNSVTESLLLKQSVNEYLGYSQSWNNVGRINNYGVELQAQAAVIKTDNFNWTVGGNISFNSNKLLSLGGEEQFVSQGDRTEEYLAKVGQPVVQFYGYKTDGVWQNQEQIDNNPSFAGTDQPGGLRIVDADGNGYINADDRVVLGTPFPDFTYGISTSFSFKNKLSLSVNIQGSQGGSISYGETYYSEVQKRHRSFVEGRWFNEAYNTVNPASVPARSKGVNVMLTDYPLFDASYISLRDVTLSYTSDFLAKKLALKSLKFYVSGQNLLYFMASDYPGLNPEYLKTSGKYSSPLIEGYQIGASPVTRTVSFGLNVNF